MRRYRREQVGEALKLFENELNTLQHMSKIEKMRARKRVGDILKPALQHGDRKPKDIMTIVDDKLRSVVELFIDEIEFKKRLLEILERRAM